MIVGVDLSLTSTGIASSKGHLETIDGRKLRGFPRIEKIAQAVLSQCQRAQLTVLEGYSYGSPQSAHQLGELGGVVRYLLWDQKFPYINVAPTALKKFAVGKGNASKEVVSFAAVKFNPNVQNNNEADAFWLMIFGTCLMGALELRPKDHAYYLAQPKYRRDIILSWIQNENDISNPGGLDLRSGW